MSKVRKRDKLVIIGDPLPLPYLQNEQEPPSTLRRRRSLHTRSEITEPENLEDDALPFNGNAEPRIRRFTPIVHSSTPSIKVHKITSGVKSRSKARRALGESSSSDTENDVFDSLQRKLASLKLLGGVVPVAQLQDIDRQLDSLLEHCENKSVAEAETKADSLVEALQTMRNKNRGGGLMAVFSIVALTCGVALFSFLVGLLVYEYW